MAWGCGGQAQGAGVGGGKSAWPSRWIPRRGGRSHGEGYPAGPAREAGRQHLCPQPHALRQVPAQHPKAQIHAGLCPPSQAVLLCWVWSPWESSLDPSNEARALSGSSSVYGREWS